MLPCCCSWVCTNDNTSVIFYSHNCSLKLKKNPLNFHNIHNIDILNIFKTDVSGEGIYFLLGVGALPYERKVVCMLGSQAYFVKDIKHPCIQSWSNNTPAVEVRRDYQCPQRLLTQWFPEELLGHDFSTKLSTSWVALVLNSKQDP